MSKFVLNIDIGDIIYCYNVKSERCYEKQIEVIIKTKQKSITLCYGNSYCQTTLICYYDELNTYKPDSTNTVYFTTKELRDNYADTYKINNCNTKQYKLLNLIPHIPVDDNGIVDICPLIITKGNALVNCNKNCKSCRKNYWLESVSGDKNE